MAGIKKNLRPINKAKNKFVEWLKLRDVDALYVYEGLKEKDDGWDYYRCVSGFINETLYVVYFQVWNGETNIDYTDGENRYNKLSIDEFLELIS